MERVILAYSGGLDTSVAIPWLAEKYDAEVVAVTLDLGQGKELDDVRERAMAVGRSAATSSTCVPSSPTSTSSLPCRRGRSMKGSTAGDGARPPPDREAPRRDRGDGVGVGDRPRVHRQGQRPGADRRVGAGVEPRHPGHRTGPRMGHVAPRRDRVRPRARGFPCPPPSTAPTAPTSTCGASPSSAGCWRTPGPSPGRGLHPDEVAGRCARCARLREPRLRAGGADRGQRGGDAPSSSSSASLETIAGAHGVGRIDMCENRLVGIKSREIYEAPAAVVLHAAHRELEGLVVPRDLDRIKTGLAPVYADLVYNGLWFTPTRRAIDALVADVQQRVTGTVRLKLFKGDCRVVGRKSPHALLRRGARDLRRGRPVRPHRGRGLHPDLGAAGRARGGQGRAGRGRARRGRPGEGSTGLVASPASAMSPLGARPTPQESAPLRRGAPGRHPRDMTHLWSGRFDAAPDEEVFAFQASFAFDRRLFDDDVNRAAWRGRRPSPAPACCRPGTRLRSGPLSSRSATGAEATPRSSTGPTRTCMPSSSGS